LVTCWASTSAASRARSPSEGDPGVGNGVGGVEWGQRLEDAGDRGAVGHHRYRGTEPLRRLGEVERGIGGEGRQEQVAVVEVLTRSAAARR
jgi:hypothetical protein